MGLPGAAEGREMSAALNNDNHSPASATDDGIKKTSTTKPVTNTNMTTGNHHEQTPQKETPPSSESGKTMPSNSNLNGDIKPNATDVSSEDVDILTTEDSKPSSLVESKPVLPEPDLEARLRRVKTHVLVPLIKHPKSQAFREPVNAKALGIYPIYHQIITHPMDLGTIRKKIDRKAYSSRGEVMSDIQLVWDNAKTFNKPGHFVHEAAVVMEKVTKEKLNKLERDEAAGMFVNDNKPAKKAHVTHTPKLPAPIHPRPERRTSRKVSQDLVLPGETEQPQQLKKKYVENLSDQMKQCDSMLKELMNMKNHRPYVDPFLHSRSSSGEAMNLYRIQQRLQSDFYRHPLQFANDVRRMISDVYRKSDPEDPLVKLASDFQHNFELMFSKVEYAPVANPSLFDVGGDDDTMLSQLLSAQTQVLKIQNNVNELLQDLIVMRRAKLGPNAKTGPTNQKRKGPGAPAGRAKKPRAPRGPVKSSTKSPLTPEESLALRAEVAELSEEQQQKIVQIMVDNKETLTTDENGYTEIDLGSCSAKTVRQIQAFVKKAKGKPVQQRQRKGGAKSKAKVSESSSETSEDEAFTSDSSSSEDSDSD